MQVNGELKTATREALLHVQHTVAAACGRAFDWVRTHRSAAAGIGAVVLVVLFAIAFACSLSASVQTLQRTGQQLASEYEKLAADLASANSSGASQDASAIQELADVMERETHSWSWSVASALPVAGDDARIARALSSVNARLAHDATSPLVAGFVEYASSESLGVPADPQAAAALLDAIANIKPVVSECNQDLQGLGPAHSEQLQDVLDTARDTLGTLDAGITTLDTLLSTSGGIGDTIASLLP